MSRGLSLRRRKEIEHFECGDQVLSGKAKSFQFAFIGITVLLLIVMFAHQSKRNYYQILPLIFIPGLTLLTLYFTCQLHIMPGQIKNQKKLI